MANIPTNFEAQVTAANSSFSGSFFGFTTAGAVTINGLRDGAGNSLGNVSFAAGVTVPLTVTSGSVTGGSVILYK